MWKTDLYIVNSGNRFISNLNFYSFPFGCFLYFSTMYLYFILVSEGKSYKKEKAV